MSGVKPKEKKKPDKKIPHNGRSPCMICKAPYRLAVEYMHFEEKRTIKAIQQTLLEENGVRVAMSTLQRHFKHSNTLESVRSKYGVQLVGHKALYPDSLIKEVVDNNLQEVNKLDAMIEEDYSLYKKTVEIIHIELDEFGKPSRDNVQLLATINTNIAKSIEAKQKMLGTDAQGRAATAVESWVGLLGMAQKEEGQV